MLGVKEIAVNSYHHQAVKDVAPGFKVTAVSKDGIVEAIEKEGTDKVWGVQFHLEGFVSMGDDSFLGIFKHLVKKASENK
jgi:putative glutamine amidotransferase